MSLCISCDKEIQLPDEWLLGLYNVKRLTLSRCWPHGLKSLGFQRLKVLRVYHSPCSTLFTFSVFRSLQLLQELEVSRSDFLEEIVEDCHLPALEHVAVHKCGVSTLFNCSVFIKLQQLNYLYVLDCKLLKVIVEDERDDETSCTNYKIITFMPLTSISLANLPNLKSFSSTSSYAFNMPKLSTFWLFCCPQIEYFTFLKTSTKEIDIYTKTNRMEKFQDLNDYVRLNCKTASSLADIAGESSHGNKELETESGRVGDEKHQETTENDQP
ncbi:hypothetical protein POM88_015875 [Heracleum sosnowskyi]|uniref:Disease resistance protein At4g27190-like leucine-rich repeats domain-containing protein n=1 Tax=Heracleum sosnowskyi TaxID=360622 RepID=A0AAD8IKZ6_9APIA|nr:hypothetical protein POM88_015875 [Heracleum sosnowskyi]